MLPRRLLSLTARRSGAAARAAGLRGCAARAALAARPLSTARDLASHFSMKPDPKEHPLSEKPAESPTGYSLEKDLQRLVGKGRWKDVLSVWAQFKDTELPSRKAFNLALQAFGRRKDRLGLETTFREMEHRGVQPDAFTYRAMMMAFAGLHYPQRLKEIMAEMRAKGVALGTREYNVAVRGYARMARKEDMLDAYQEMLTEGCKPDIRTFTHIMTGFCRVGTQEDISQVDQERDQHGVEADQKYMDVLARAYKGTDIERADRHLGEH